MSEQDPARLANEMDRQADEMQQRSEQLGSEVGEVRQDWERKRQDEGVPGAPMPDAADEEPGESPEDAARGESSPAPQAPPPEEGPSASDMANEGQAGPPADSDGAGRGDSDD